jgi:hypothetical protein
MPIESYYGIEGITIETPQTASELFEALDAIHSLVIEAAQEGEALEAYNSVAFDILSKALNDIGLLEEVEI